MNREGSESSDSSQNSGASDSRVEQLLTRFCLLGPRNCIHGSSGVYQRREQSVRQPYTTGTAHARLPTTPTGFHQDPAQSQPTNHY